MTDRLDEAIDRAVREMLDVEPPADLRARVIERIGSAHRRGGSRTAPTLWAATFAAAALVVLALFLARRSEPLPQAAAVARADQHLAPEAAPRAGTEPVPQIAAPPAIRQQSAPVQTRATVVAVSLDDNATTVIAPLKTITAIAVAPITQESIAPADIAVRPLNTITELQVAPLTPPDRR